MSELTCLDARYYLFGAYFEPELINQTKQFPNWHQEAQLKNNRSLTIGVLFRLAVGSGTG